MGGIIANSAENIFSYSRTYLQGVAAPLASVYPSTGSMGDFFFGKVLPKNSSDIGDLYRMARAEKNSAVADTMLRHYRTAINNEHISQGLMSKPYSKSLFSRLASFIINSPIGKLFSGITKGIANIPILGKILSLGGGRVIPILSAIIAFGDCLNDIDMAVTAYCRYGFVGFWMKKAVINTTCTLIGTAIGFLCGGLLGAAVGAGFGNLIGNLFAPARPVRRAAN